MHAGEVRIGITGALVAGIGALVGVGTIRGVTLIIGRLRDTTIGLTTRMDITFIGTTITDTTRDITTDTDTTIIDQTIDRIEIMLRFITEVIVEVRWEIQLCRKETIVFRDDMCRVEARQTCA